MSININTWGQFLEQTTLKGFENSHSYICETKRNDGPTCVEVLSEKEYDSFFQENSSWNSFRRKFSLAEIVSISKKFLLAPCDKKGNTFRATAMSRMSTLCLRGDLTASDAETPIQQTFKVIENEINERKKISGSVEKMLQRSTHKHTATKVSSLWEKIKCYIWSCFFDKSSSLKEIQRAVPDLQEIKNRALEGVRDRVLLNIDTFEEAISVPEEQRNTFVDTACSDKFANKKGFIKGWLTKYAPDKYTSPVSEDAKVARIRVFALLKIWDACEALGSDKDIS